MHTLQIVTDSEFDSHEATPWPPSTELPTVGDIYEGYKGQYEVVKRIFTAPDDWGCVAVIIHAVVTEPIGI